MTTTAAISPAMGADRDLPARQGPDTSEHDGANECPRAESLADFGQGRVWVGADRRARSDATSSIELGTIAIVLPSRLDRLLWSRFHWRTVSGLGTAWMVTNRGMNKATATTELPVATGADADADAEQERAGGALRRGLAVVQAGRRGVSLSVGPVTAGPRDWLARREAQSSGRT